MANEDTKSDTTPVAMTDGRVVEFSAKKKLIKTQLTDADAGTAGVRLDFANGETRTYSVPAEHLLRAAAHGWSQKLGDALAGLKDEAGNDASIDDCVETIDDLFERISSGDWNAKREGSGMAGMSVLAQAMHEHFGGKKTLAEIKAFLKAKTQAEKIAYRRSPLLKPIIDRLEAAKAAKGTANVNVEDDLAAFAGGDNEG